MGGKGSSYAPPYAAPYAKKTTWFSLAVMKSLGYTSNWPMDRSEIEKISKALADQTRLRIFEAIAGNGRMSCGDIVSRRGVTPATVSHHLRILSEAGLIACQRQGQFVYSQTVPETLSAYARALAKIARGKKPARRR